MGETLLAQVLTAQEDSAAALASTEIKRSADALVRHATALGSPWLMAVSPMAERLVGAALLASDGMLRAVDDGRIPREEHVLLVEAVAVSAVALETRRDLLVRLGAARVDLAALRLLSITGREGVAVLAA